MRALLVRHGLTGETGRILSGRLAGLGLSDRGRLDARVIADYLAGREVAAIYTSPVQRCRETARMIAGPHTLAPLTDRRLIEADYGRWAGRTLKDLQRLKAWQRLMAHASRFRFPEGETLTEVQVRAVAAFEELALKHGDETVIVVSHADVIRTLLCHYLGTPLDLIHRLQVGPTSLSIIELNSDGAVRVPVVNHVLPGPA